MPRTETRTLYKGYELEGEARDTAHINWCEWKDKHDDYPEWDMFDSYKALVEHLDCIVRDYSLGLYNDNYARIAGNISDIIGKKRRMAWLENNLYGPLRIKCGSSQHKSLRRYGNYYRPGMVKPGPLTGMCYDEDIIERFASDFINSSDTVVDTLKGMIDYVAELYKKEYEWSRSMECFMDDEYTEFTGKGEMV